MFRKTLSKNRIKLSQALRQEFGVYLRRMEGSAARILSKYPKPVFSVMLICMSGSITAVFFVRSSPQREVYARLTSSPAIMESTGISGLFTTGMALKEVIELQGRLNALLYKDSLNKSDSVILLQTTRRLEYIQHQLKPKP
jgi:hypothetical protein